MIDLHCHLLPALDDGATDMQMSLAMAGMAVADGITHVICTPHITPGVYDHSARTIAIEVALLQQRLDREGIPLIVGMGADVHMSPSLPDLLTGGDVPTINGSRYFLFEPPHSVAPPRIEDAVKQLVAAGFIPIITHPERLAWVEKQYNLLGAMVAQGALLQLTAGSIIGAFGRRAQMLSERMLEENLVDIIATDAHNTTSRPPLLSQARDTVARRLGEEEADAMVLHRPAAILENRDIPPKAGRIMPQIADKRLGFRERVAGWLQGLRG